LTGSGTHRNVTGPLYVGIMSLQPIASISCVWCDAQLQHCHGTAIVLDDTTRVCSDDPDCTLDVDEHWFIALDEDKNWSRPTAK
jgi:hypothetical protein